MSHHRSGRARQRLVAALTALLVAGAAGCSGAPDDSPAPSDTPSESASGSPSESSSDEASESPTDDPSVTDSSSASGSPDVVDPFDHDAATPIDDEGVVRVIATEQQLGTLSGGALIVRTLPDLEPAYTLEPSRGSLMDVRLPEAGPSGYLLSAVPMAGTGTSVGRDVFTVQEFDRETGDVTTTSTVRLARDPAVTVGNAVPRLKGIVGRTAVLDVTHGRGDQASHTAVAIDLDKGVLAWRHRGERVLTVTGKAVVVFRGNATTPGDVAGLAPQTGRQRWAGLSATSEVSLVGSTAKRVLLARSGPFGILAIASVDLRTGGSGAGQAIDTAKLDCRAATPSVAVCLLPGKRLVGWGLNRNTELWSLPSKSRYAPTVTLVGLGQAYGNVGADWVSLDARTGEDVAGGTGPAPIAASKSGAVFIEDRQLTWAPRLDPTP